MRLVFLWHKYVHEVNLVDSGNLKVNMTHFDVLKCLGTGGRNKRNNISYGHVYLVRKRSGSDMGRLYAMKVLRKAHIVLKKKTEEHTMTERQILEAIRDIPFLVTLYYAFQSNANLYLILEYVAGGELFRHLGQHEKFSENTVRIYIGEIILALERLHQLGIIYRDIKLENILLDREGHIVLTDFGLSKEFQPHELKAGRARTYSFCGTIEYMAPEVVESAPNGYDMAVDWWSVGVLTYELLTGASPFTLEGDKNQQQDVSRRILKSDPPPMPNDFSPQVTNFISRLLVKDPRRRLGGGPRDAKELKEHPFFTDAAPAFTWEALERKQIEPPFVPQIRHELDTSNFSEEFTRMNVEHLATTENNRPQIKYFRDYSYVAPSVIFTDNTVSRNIFGDESRPSLSNIHLHNDLKDSTFFQTYEIVRDVPSLGQGSYSICVRCQHRVTKQEYAVKIVSRRIDCSREENLLRICHRHANVVKLIDVHRDHLHTYLVMELLSGGELLQRSLPFTERQAKRIMRQLASAVRFMHSHGVVHRDLKPENIVFSNQNEDFPVKIVDFGFARKKTSREPLNTPCFTLPYAAPEVIARQDYDESCDMWSLGVILYYMLSGNPPSSDMATRIREIDFDSNIWSHISDAAKQVVKGLLTIDRNERLTAAAFVSHSWLLKDTSHFPVTPLPDVIADVHAAPSNSSTTEHTSDGFRLRAVGAAKLAQRRKNKRSTSHSSSSTSRPSSSSSSSPMTIQPRPPSNAATSTSSVFDFNEEKVNEYLSSLSSSSDSNSPRLSQPPESLVAKRDLASSKTSISQRGSSSSSSNGPMTRSRKRKLEMVTNSSRNVGSNSSVESVEHVEPHAKRKTKRSKRASTIVVE
ncbi:ribosomal protein S6 kinase alpha-5-like isoform X2 [Pseudomyrmex gracilis]|uniref:ribosomal protein S6 kinase alpha-5-like isoform X2 n=1 Tax=Pseudomyrmex gracilis TaxID=219809 RepID=UPI000995C368|nr:ribosomal protein S6 kinase alpha-5-like isoform X2 [Pseudomyrmex gracilis]